MAKFKFEKEYEFMASSKMLYNYIFAPDGLERWFADKVELTPKGVYEFHWDNKTHEAKLAAKKRYRHVKFEFVGETEEDQNDPNYLEFFLENSELTGSVFLKVVDYSEIDDNDELEELWDGLINSLKEVVGG